MKVKNFLPILIAVLLMGTAFWGKAQRQLHLTQYNLHQPFINPASISSYSDISAALLYKKQWVGFDGAPTFQGLDFNMPLGEDTKSSVGLTAFNDQIGINRRTDIGLNYAYELQLNKKSYLSLGLTGSLVMLQSNYSQLELQDPEDPRFAKDSPNLFTANFRFGAYYYRDNFYWGFATPNLLKNRVVGDNNDFSTETRFDPKAIHYYTHAGYQLQMGDELKLQPSLLLKYISGSPLQVDVNAQVLFKDRYGLGVAYRTSKIINPFLNVRFGPLRLGYSYDYNFSELNTVSSGSHEIILIYERRVNKKPVKVNIPRF